ncbi:hypothetical protein M0R45_030889 [Rubus argutus]|uniref:Uncharacterized protein n=1 Tax=Rubus argutus TaxID=59490 RepID=A0AAW1WGN6_RUBAR
MGSSLFFLATSSFRSVPFFISGLGPVRHRGLWAWICGIDDVLAVATARRRRFIDAGGKGSLRLELNGKAVGRFGYGGEVRSTVWVMMVNDGRGDLVFWQGLELTAWVLRWDVEIVHGL